MTTAPNSAILDPVTNPVQTCQGRITPQSGQVFRNNDSYTPCFDLDQHTLKAGAVIVRARRPRESVEYR